MPNSKDEESRIREFHEAIRIGGPAYRLRLMLNENPYLLNRENVAGEQLTPIMTACLDNAYPAFLFLIKQPGIELMAKAKNKLNVLFWAIDLLNTRIILQLLEKEPRLLKTKYTPSDDYIMEEGSSIIDDIGKNAIDLLENRINKYRRQGEHGFAQVASIIHSIITEFKAQELMRGTVRRRRTRRAARRVVRRPGSGILWGRINSRRASRASSGRGSSTVSSTGSSTGSRRNSGAVSSRSSGRGSRRNSGAGSGRRSGRTSRASSGRGSSRRSYPSSFDSAHTSPL